MPPIKQIERSAQLIEPAPEPVKRPLRASEASTIKSDPRCYTPRDWRVLANAAAMAARPAIRPLQQTKLA